MHKLLFKMQLLISSDELANCHYAAHNSSPSSLLLDLALSIPATIAAVMTLFVFASLISLPFANTKGLSKVSVSTWKVNVPEAFPSLFSKLQFLS